MSYSYSILYDVRVCMCVSFLLSVLAILAWQLDPPAWTLCHSHSNLTKSAKPDHTRFTVAPLLHKAARKPALLAQPGRQPLPSTCHKLHHFYVHFTCSVITIRCLSWTGFFGCFRCPVCKVCNESVKKLDKIWQANPIEPSSVASLAASHGSKDLAISGSTLLPCLGASNACIVHIDAYRACRASFWLQTVSRCSKPACNRC